jgi:hypothetical protein
MRSLPFLRLTDFTPASTCSLSFPGDLVLAVSCGFLQPAVELRILLDELPPDRLPPTVGLVIKSPP